VIALKFYYLTGEASFVAKSFVFYHFSSIIPPLVFGFLFVLFLFVGFFRLVSRFFRFVFVFVLILRLVVVADGGGVALVVLEPVVQDRRRFHPHRLLGVPATVVLRLHDADAVDDDLVAGGLVLVCVLPVGVDPLGRRRFSPRAAALVDGRLLGLGLEQAAGGEVRVLGADVALDVVVVVEVARFALQRGHGQVQAAHLLLDGAVQRGHVHLAGEEAARDQRRQVGVGGEVGRVGERHAAQPHALLGQLQQPLVEQQPELDGVEGALAARLVARRHVRGHPVGHLLLQPHAVVVEPVGDGAARQAQLGRQELDGGHVGVGVERERQPQRLLLLLREEHALLLGGAGARRVGMVELGRVVRGGVGAVVVRSGAGRPPPLVRLPALVLQRLQAVDVVRVVQPQLHPDEGLPALDAQHVPRLRLRQKLAHRALGQPQHGLPKNLQQPPRFL
jgi:hypothetical protein